MGSLLPNSARSVERFSAIVKMLEESIIVVVLDHFFRRHEALAEAVVDIA